MSVSTLLPIKKRPVRVDFSNVEELANIPLHERTPRGSKPSSPETHVSAYTQDAPLNYHKASTKDALTGKIELRHRFPPTDHPDFVSIDEQAVRVLSAERRSQARIDYVPICDDTILKPAASIGAQSATKTSCSGPA